MEFKINIAKKHLYYLVGLLVFVFITAIAIAQSSAPNPGHAATEIGEGTIAGALTISGGNVGIGTTSLNLGGYTKALTISAGTSGTALSAIELQGSRTVTGGFGAIDFRHQSNLVAQFTGLRDGADDAGGLTFFTKATGGILAEKVRIDSNGNVGIGTTSPGVKLHVQGGDLRIVDDSTGQDPQIQTYGESSGTAGTWATYAGGALKWITRISDTASGVTYSLQDREATGTPTRFFINENGNVGIGTTNPLFNLVVASPSVNANIAVADSGDSYNRRAQIGHSDVNGGSLILWDDSNNMDVVISSYGNSYLNGGNVGIGTTSPRGKLQIGNLHDTFGLPTYPGDFILDGSPSGSNAVGGIEFRSSVSAGGAGWKITASGNYQDSKLFFANRAGGTTWDTEVLTLAHTGNVGIGTTSPEMTLDVQGGIRAHAWFETKADSAPTDQKIWQLNTQSSGFYIGTWNDARNAEQLAYQIRRSGYAVTNHIWYINNQQKMALDGNGNFAINNLAGTGNAYACVNANGQLYRSATVCS